MSDDLRVEIQGGVGPYEAAAILAVIQESLAIEERARSRRPPDRRPAAWARLGMATPMALFDPPVVPDPGRNWPD